VAQVTSIVRDRGRALVIVSAVAITTALVAAPSAFALGDPIASGTASIKLSSGFKKQLKQNGVKVKPKKLKITGGSNLDPTTGQGLLRVGKITFKKGGKKVVLKNSKVTLGASGAKGNLTGTAKGGTAVKLYKLSGGTVARTGFGAALTGVKVKFLKGAAKKLNKLLGLHSLHPGSAGKLAMDEQPTTVQVTGGRIFIDIPSAFLADATTVIQKNGSHCFNLLTGTVPIAPATLSLAGNPPGILARITLPISGGTIGPDGKAGAVTAAGGLRLQTGGTGAPCANETAGEGTSRTFLRVTNLAPNLQLGNVQSNVFIGGVKPGCNFADPNAPAGCGSPLGIGDRGISIGQTLDTSAAVFTGDAGAHTVGFSNILIKNNGLTAGTFNALFPNSSGNPAENYADGDKFGFSSGSLTTR
jgi:hypothetical protein